MFIFWHQIVDLSRIFGIRDRLRCPTCKAVGTWKPHGGWIDVWLGDNAGYRRWMCKWCGLTRVWYGDTADSVPSTKLGCWVHKSNSELTEADLTPAVKCHPVNPWRG